MHLTAMTFWKHTDHMTLKQSNYHFRVRVSYENDKVQMSNIVEYFIHPQYDPRTFANDIALVKIPKLHRFNRHQQAICLPRELLTQNVSSVPNSLFALGWGGTTNVQQGKIASIQDLSKKLKQVKIPIIANQECANNVHNKTRA